MQDRDRHRNRITACQEVLEDTADGDMYDKYIPSTTVEMNHESLLNDDAAPRIITQWAFKVLSRMTGSYASSRPAD